jgi:hypothetical protein
MTVTLHNNCCENLKFYNSPFCRHFNEKCFLGTSSCVCIYIFLIPHVTIGCKRGGESRRWDRQRHYSRRRTYYEQNCKISSSKVNKQGRQMLFSCTVAQFSWYSCNMHTNQYSYLLLTQPPGKKYAHYLEIRNNHYVVECLNRPLYHKTSYYFYRFILFMKHH